MVAMVKEGMLGAGKSYLKAISVDPYFDSAYSNLAELFRTYGKINQVAAVYNRALKNNTTSALLPIALWLCTTLCSSTAIQ